MARSSTSYTSETATTRATRPKGHGGPAKGPGWGGAAKGAGSQRQIAAPLTSEQAKIAVALRDTADAKARRAAREAAQAEVESRAFQISLSLEGEAAMNALPRAHVMLGGATRTELTGADAGPIDIRSIPTDALLAALAAADGAAGSDSDPSGTAAKGSTD